MQYRIQLFAGMAEQLGDVITVELSQETVTMADIRKRLNELYPEVTSQLPGSFLPIIKSWLRQMNLCFHQMQLLFISQHPGWRRSFQNVVYLPLRTTRLMPMK